MVDSWVGENSEGTVESLAEDCMRLSLAVISKAGFGKEMTWPTKNSTEKNVGEAEIDERQHSMSFQHALAMLVSSVYFVAILPKTLMRKSSRKTITCVCLLILHRICTTCFP